MLNRKRITGVLLGLALLMGGTVATTANAMGPPGPQDTKLTAADRGGTSDSKVDMTDIIRSLP